MNGPVLIVIDMLRDFLDGWAPGARERLVQSTKKLVLTMSEYGHIAALFSSPVAGLR
jgi:hypothetical protein